MVKVMGLNLSNKIYCDILDFMKRNNIQNLENQEHLKLIKDMVKENKEVIK